MRAAERRGAALRIDASAGATASKGTHRHREGGCAARRERRSRPRLGLGATLRRTVDHLQAAQLSPHAVRAHAVVRERVRRIGRFDADRLLTPRADRSREVSRRLSSRVAGRCAEFRTAGDPCSGRREVGSHGSSRAAPGDDSVSKRTRSPDDRIDCLPTRGLRRVLPIRDRAVILNSQGVADAGAVYDRLLNLLRETDGRLFALVLGKLIRRGSSPSIELSDGSAQQSLALRPSPFR